MTRIMIVTALACALVSGWRSQDRLGTLPPGPAPGPADQSWLASLLLVQANMIEGGEVLFLVPRPEEGPDKIPPAPSIIARVDGKTVKAFGTDRKKLDIAELNQRLSLRAAAVVVHGQVPDPFFLKALHERTVVFVVPKKMFERMAQAVKEPSIQGWWTAIASTGALEAPAAEAWIIEESKIKLRAGDQAAGSMTYKIDAEAEPRGIDLTPEHGPGQGKTLRGIYQLDGLSLKVCYVSPECKEPEKAERPRDFGEPGTLTREFRRMLP